jgi:hypothetical protein
MMKHKPSSTYLENHGGCDTSFHWWHRLSAPFQYLTKGVD